MAEKSEKRSKARTPASPSRLRTFLSDRKRVLGAIGAAISFATTAAVIATVVVAHRPLVARATTLKQEQLRVAFDWPPLAGKTTSRTATGEPATWMNAEQRAELERVALKLLSGNPFDRQALERAQSALAGTGWFAEGPWLKRYENGVVVVSGAWRVPAAAVRTTSGDRLVDSGGEVLPVLYPQGRSRMPIISGVRAAEPPAGEAWPGGEVQAGLSLLAFLRPMPGFDHIACVDVSRFASSKRLILETITGGRIVWGGPPGEFQPGQARGTTKRQRLAAVFQQFGQLDAGRPEIDVRSEDGVYTTDTTLAARSDERDPASSGKPSARAGSRKQAAAKNRR